MLICCNASVESYLTFDAEECTITLGAENISNSVEYYGIAYWCDGEAVPAYNDSSCSWYWIKLQTDDGDYKIFTDDGRFDDSSSEPISAHNYELTDSEISIVATSSSIEAEWDGSDFSLYDDSMYSFVTCTDDGNTTYESLDWVSIETCEEEKSFADKIRLSILAAAVLF